MTNNPLTDPQPIEEIDLTDSGGLSALVYGHLNLDPNVNMDIDLSILSGILEIVQTALPMDDAIDTGDFNMRGPYDVNQVNVFYHDSGLADVVTLYYDDDTGEFWVYINTD